MEVAQQKLIDELEIALRSADQVAFKAAADRCIESTIGPPKLTQVAIYGCNAGLEEDNEHMMYASEWNDEAMRCSWIFCQPMCRSSRT